MLLYKERATLAIPEHQELAQTPRASAIHQTFLGFDATTSVPDSHLTEDQKQQQAEWEALREQHVLSFLIAPYEVGA